MKNQIVANLARTVDELLSAERSGKAVSVFSEYRLILEAIEALGVGYEAAAAHLTGNILSLQRSPAAALQMQGLVRESRRELDGACEAFAAACVAAPHDPMCRIGLAKMLVRSGRFEEARRLLQELAGISALAATAEEALLECESAERMPGDDYYALLSRIHTAVRPRTYLEIGLGHGKSLALAGDGTVALGVDPVMAQWNSLYFCREQPAPKLFPLTSNDFFTRHDIRSEMGGKPCDLAFIDGLHIFEQVLMDFANVEQQCQPSSVILLHDCLPVHPLIAERERCTGFWTGDVWKVIPCLKAVRPDLTIVTIPAAPSGLAVVTNLDPASQVLARHFERAVDHFIGLELPGSWEETCAMMNCTDNRDGILAGLPAFG